MPVYMKFGVNSSAEKAWYHLEGVHVNLMDLGPAFEDIGRFYRAQVQVQFEEHGFVPGVAGGWSPLSPNTTEKKRLHKFSPLIEYGKLEKSLTLKAAPMNINDIDMYDAAFGTSDPVAIYQHLGTHNHNDGMQHIPARPIILGNNILDQYIVYGVSKHLFRFWGKMK